MPGLRVRLAVGDGYEEALADSSPERVAVDRSGDDHYVIYTGGTTGMPKGVVWRQEDAFFACFGGGDPMRLLGMVEQPEQVVERILDSPFVFLPLAPLMHGAAQWTSFMWLFGGGVVVLTPSRPRTDYAEVWRLVTEEKVNLIVVVGDAVARPLIEEYLAHRDDYDTSSVITIGSGGAPLSPSLKATLAELFPNVFIADGYGTSETGAQATNLGGSRFSPMDTHTIVLDEETLEPIEPGSGATGRVARRGHIPFALPQGPGEDGGHVRRARRRTVGAHRRHGDGARRRQHRDPRPRFAVHQHRRREGLPRRGRVGVEGAPVRVRRGGGRCR